MLYVKTLNAEIQNDALPKFLLVVCFFAIFVDIFSLKRRAMQQSQARDHTFGGIIRKGAGGKNIVWEKVDALGDLYYITVDSPENATYIALWVSPGQEGEKKIGFLRAQPYSIQMGAPHLPEKPWLSIKDVEIEKPYRGLGFSRLMYKALLHFASEEQVGMFSHLSNRHNTLQVPKIWDNYISETHGDYQFVLKSKNKDRFQGGGGLQVISPEDSTSEQSLKKIGDYIKKAVRTNEAFRLIDTEPELEGSDWGNGVCYPLALAIQRVYGGRLAFIKAGDKDGRPEHVIVKIGRGYLDHNGYEPELKKIQAAKAEGVKDPDIWPVTETTDFKDLGYGSDAFIDKVADLISPQHHDTNILVSQLENKYPVDVWIHDAEMAWEPTIVLNRLIVDNNARETGVGTKVMQEICAYADKKGLRISLTPSEAFGGNFKRLKEFYARFGFVSYPDPDLIDRYVRLPKKEKKKLPGKITILQGNRPKKADGGELDDSSYKTLLSLFDFSGTWAKPFLEAGWNVIQWDIKLSEFMDINRIDSAEYALDEFGDIDGIIAAPPCTDFTTSGNQWWAFKDETGQTWKSVQLVNQVMKLVDLYAPTDPEYDGVWFWAIENPVGRMGTLVGLPMAPWYFQPWEFAGYLDLSKKDLQRLSHLREKEGTGLSMDDAMFVQKTNAYAKKTGLWGEFKIPEPKKPIDPVYSLKGGQRTAPIDALTGGKSARTKELRSNTPLGFAIAFFEANKNYRAHLQPIVEEKSKKGKPKNSSKVTYFGRNDMGEPYRWERVSVYDEYCTNPDEIVIYDSEKALIVIEYAELGGGSSVSHDDSRWFYNTRIVQGDGKREPVSKYRVYASRRNFPDFIAMVHDATGEIKQYLDENQFPEEAVRHLNEFVGTTSELKTGGAVIPIVLTPAELKARWDKKKDGVMNLAGSMQSLKNNLGRDLKSENEKTKLIALLLLVMIKTAERLGNEDSAEEEGHYGVTYFLKSHCKVEENSVSFNYIGKSGVSQSKEFSDERIARALDEALSTSPDKYIFTTSEGRKITPTMVNHFLSKYGDISAKDIRGFSANFLILKKLKSLEDSFAGIPGKIHEEREKQFREAVKYAAERVGHSPATLKKHYLLPELESKFINSGKLLDLSDFDKKELGGDLVTHYQLPEEYLYETGGSAASEIEKRSELKKAVDNMKAFKSKHGEELSGKGVEQFRELAKAILDLKYELRNPIDVIKIGEPKGRKSVVPAEIIKTAWNDLVRSKKIFDEIAMAAIGVEYNANTSIDKIALGENPNVSAIELYREFDKTRSALKGTYGEIITLYRAEGRQINKPTQNWASTKEGAMQYGSHVIKREIPIDNILALNTGISGKYEEFIVGKKPEYERGGKRFSSGGVMELLAPNGKPSNLTPEQYKLVRTPAFKNWFGDWLKAYDTKDYNGVSKVIDENGEPRVMFHGSNSIHEITTFQPTSGKPYSFFAADINEAGRYTNMLNHIKPFFIKAKRDYDVRHLSKEEQAQTGALFDKNWAELYIQLRKNLMISEIEELAYDTMKIDHLPEIFNIDYSDYESGKWLELARKTITAKDKNIICEFLWQVLTKTTNDWMLLETDVFQQYLDDNNYDGFWTTEGWNGNIAVYNSRNIKLADGSNTTFDPNNPDIRYSHGGSLSADQKEIYDKWKSLVNMSVGDLSNFYHTKEGKEAGLSKDEAHTLGIHNGRESARWILKMKKTPVAEWTPEMWEWAKRQISFISRMKGNKGGLYDENGNKTRKHTSLLIWGHDPEKLETGGGLDGGIYTQIQYAVNIGGEDWADVQYMGNDFRDAKSEFDSIDNREFGSRANHSGNYKELSKREIQYRFIANLEEGEYIEDYTEDDYLKDDKYWEVIVESDWEQLEADAVAPVNEKADELLSDVQGHFHAYGGYKTIYLDEDETVSLKLRIKDHSGKHKNKGIEDYFLSIVVSDQNPTKHFKTQGPEGLSSEEEFEFGSDSSKEEIVDFINEKIKELQDEAGINSSPVKFESGGPIEIDFLLPEGKPTRILPGGELLNFPGASTLQLTQDKKLFVISDNAPYVLVLDKDEELATGTDRKDVYYEKKIQLVPGSAAMPKNLKLDLEASFMTHREIFLVGSGSRPIRRILVKIPLTTHKPQIIDISVFIDRLITMIPDVEINIEGAEWFGDKVLLVNREKHGGRFILTDMNFWENQFMCSIQVFGVLLGHDSSISEVKYLPAKDILFFASTTEHTENAYDDGEIGDSYLGIISNFKSWLASPGLLTVKSEQMLNLTEQDPAFKQQKIEGIAIDWFRRNIVTLYLVADNDGDRSELWRFQVSVTPAE